ncbi:MAG: peptidoglycan-binding protein [Acidimicrobiales bacterium]
MKGDDVADLQRQLSALGFDIGKVDGMFGRDTANGLAEFQTNVGLHADSVCGYRTIAELDRVLLCHSGTELVASVKDRERLRHRPKTLAGTTVFIAESGGLNALVSALKRGISDTSATVLEITHPNESVQASSANAVGADVCLALLLTDSPGGSVISYYAGHTYESPGGKRLAELSGQYLNDSLDIDDITIKGMSVPILRETKMPSVLCQIGPAPYVVKYTSLFASALARALIDWAICPIND